MPDTGASSLSTEQVARVLKLLGIAGGVVVPARWIQRKPGGSVVRLRRLVPEQLPPALFLGRRGIDVVGEQQTRTRKALEFFASELPGST